MKLLKYRRNWVYEQMADVFFVDGTEERCLCHTDSKGQIAFIEYDGTRYKPDEFGLLGVSTVHFMTPAQLQVTSPVEVLVDAYKRLGETISEGNTSKKVSKREQIAKEIRKRGINLHEVL